MDTEAMAAHKKELRSELRARRAEAYGGPAGTAHRARESRLLLERAAALIAHVEATLTAAPAQPVLVAAYHPTPTEADVMPLARHLAELGAHLIFPVAAGRELDWVSWDGSSPFLDSPGRGFGKEPSGSRLGPGALAAAALVLAPAVAVDRSGTRIGHGAGYYDRALTAVRADAAVVAVVHPGELLEAGTLPREEHDVPIPAVLTADALVSLVTIDGSWAPRPAIRS
ncbi:5-formyltetrahydrofolate cyclo-ligase [Brachybacterium sp. FME24]|uniref:5-formyltetrahydrofolate cyclo-ligase n=1 Tax=Brachybacterium sp. FME24 TaxID=2742605 RepID=UPI001866A13C|nr:5-formyltetrahydrofolate cyclo-ligase [Brachybacterium sp. FME24]